MTTNFKVFSKFMKNQIQYSASCSSITQGYHQHTHNIQQQNKESIFQYIFKIPQYTHYCIPTRISRSCHKPIYHANCKEISGWVTSDNLAFRLIFCICLHLRITLLILSSSVLGSIDKNLQVQWFTAQLSSSSRRTTYFP